MKYGLQMNKVYRNKTSCYREMKPASQVYIRIGCREVMVTNTLQLSQRVDIQRAETNICFGYNNKFTESVPLSKIYTTCTGFFFPRPSYYYATLNLECMDSKIMSVINSILFFVAGAASRLRNRIQSYDGVCGRLRTATLSP